jgi:serine O-acetyltransferase
MKTFKKDIQRIEGGVFRKMLNISFWIILNFRISNFFYRNGFFIISKFFWLANRIVFTVDIDPGANLAGGLKLTHPMCIVVGREVISLGNLTLYQSTTLGGSNNQEVIYNGKTVKQPYIYTNVIIYTSSVVIGPLIIGENSTVATNSTITKNVPENSIAYGVNKIKNKTES